MTEKMRNTELVFILDKSGSIGGLEEDTIGGFNSVLKKQKKSRDGGNVRVTTVLFDDRYTLLHDRFDIGGIKPITSRAYGISKEQAVNYHADRQGTSLNYQAVNEAVSAVRKSSAPLTGEWKKRIEKDFESR